MLLPAITQTSVGKIHDFYKKLLTHFQASEIMGKLTEISRYFRLTFNKLPTICADLVLTDNDWQE